MKNEKIAQEVYPEVSLLQQVKGVETQIALPYLRTVEDPYRFVKSGEVHRANIAHQRVRVGGWRQRRLG
jgi:hypothetical protein